MSKNNQELTMKGQARISIVCYACASLLWLLLLVLGGQITEIFFIILIAYHIIGGLLSRDIAKSMIGAIIFAPIYVGGKIAICIQHVQVQDRLNNKLSTKNLFDLNREIVYFIKEHPDSDVDDTIIPMFGCATYRELNEFNELVVQLYNNRKK